MVKVREKGDQNMTYKTLKELIYVCICVYIIKLKIAYGNLQMELQKVQMTQKYMEITI